MYAHASNVSCHLIIGHLIACSLERSGAAQIHTLIS